MPPGEFKFSRNKTKFDAPYCTLYSKCLAFVLYSTLACSAVYLAQKADTELVSSVTCGSKLS